MTDKLNYRQITGIPSDVRFSKDGKIEELSVVDENGCMSCIKVDFLALQKDEQGDSESVQKEIDDFVSTVSGAPNALSRYGHLISYQQQSELYKRLGDAININIDEDTVLLDALHDLMKKSTSHSEVAEQAYQLWESEGPSEGKDDEPRTQAKREMSPTLVVFGGSKIDFFAVACIYKAAEIGFTGNVVHVLPESIVHSRSEIEEFVEENKGKLKSYTHLDGYAKFSEDSAGRLQLHLHRDGQLVETRQAGDLIVNGVAKNPDTPFNRDLINKGLLKRNTTDEENRPYAPVHDDVNGHYSLVAEDLEKYKDHELTPEMFKKISLYTGKFFESSPHPSGWKEAFRYSANLTRKKSIDRGR